MWSDVVYQMKEEQKMKGKKWLIGSLLVAATGILGACGGRI